MVFGGLAFGGKSLAPRANDFPPKAGHPKAFKLCPQPPHNVTFNARMWGVLDAGFDRGRGLTPGGDPASAWQHTPSKVPPLQTSKIQSHRYTPPRIPLQGYPRIPPQGYEWMRVNGTLHRVSPNHATTTEVSGIFGEGREG